MSGCQWCTTARPCAYHASVYGSLDKPAEPPPEVPAPAEMWLVVEHDGQPYAFWTRKEDVCEPIPEGGAVVRYVRSRS